MTTPIASALRHLPAAGLGAAAIVLALQAPRFADGSAVHLDLPWVPSLGVSLSFTFDGLALLFGILVLGIGALVLVYASSYLRGHPAISRFHLFFGLFLLAMLGLVTASNLLLLFLFWELTGVASYFLVGFEHERERARAAALQALLVTGSGGLALLAGFLLLGQMAGSYQIDAIHTAAQAVRVDSLYLPMLGLILIGAFTKSAQVPFHFWLPGAMEAPAPVSAYLHSATMVKAGVYLLARLHPALGDTDAWHYGVSAAGAATMLVGAVMALAQTDLKRLLAYSTVAALGTLVLLLGLGTALSIQAAITVLLVHALYKGSLFLAAGSVDHETGSRNLRELRGLRRAMPCTATAAFLAALSMAGLPPLLGFIAKELLYEAKLQAPMIDPWLMVGGFAASVLLVTAALRIGLQPFAGGASALAASAHEAPRAMWLPPLLLAILGLVIGMWPRQLAEPLVAGAVQAARGEPTTIKLALWHGWNPVLGLSMATLVAGAVLYRYGAGVISFLQARSASARDWGPQAAYEGGLRLLKSFAAGVDSLSQNGPIRVRLRVVLASAALLIAVAMLAHGISVPAARSGLRIHELAISLLVAGAAVGTVLAASPLAAVACLGAAGYGIALLFALFGAPDLAMTQFAVETLAVILLALVLRRLRPVSLHSSAAARWCDVATAGAVGATIALALLTVGSEATGSRLASFFAEASLLQAKGRNVVNVILVDFRALDTLGEIIVLSLAALGAIALGRRGRAAPTGAGAASPDGAPFLLRIAAGYLILLLLGTSLLLLLRGHHSPGGGFTGGLIAGAGFALLGLARGRAAAQRALRWRPVALITAGLAIATASGAVALTAGRPLLSGLWTPLALPIAGKLGTPLLFDAGVYLVVVGVVLTLFFHFAEE